MELEIQPRRLSSEMLREAMPLLSTYFSGADVRLGSMEVQLSQGEIGSDSDTIVRARHLLAIGRTLQSVVDATMKSPSRTMVTAGRMLSNEMRGSVDVGRYGSVVAERRSGRAILPVRLGVESYRLPENELIVALLRLLRRCLTASYFPANSAESLAAEQLLRWVTQTLRRESLSGVAISSSIDRLIETVSVRLRRRQVRELHAYTMLHDSARMLRGDAVNPDSSCSDLYISALLAFPESEQFSDRVFEVWTLGQIVSSFERLGWTLVARRATLNGSGDQSVIEFARSDIHAHVFFQSGLSLGDASWSYEGGRPLVGIPDIVIHTTNGTSIVVDAKNRSPGRGISGRSDEIYKMLGYSENYASLRNRLRAMLVLPSHAVADTHLAHPGGGRLALVACPSEGSRPSWYVTLDRVLASLL